MARIYIAVAIQTWEGKRINWAHIMHAENLCKKITNEGWAA